MHISTVLPFLPLLTLSTALPNPSPQDASSAAATPRKFTLHSVSTLLSKPKYNNLALTTYHYGAGLNYAVLVSPSENIPGIVGQFNGTDQEVKSGNASVFFPQANFPPGAGYGLEVDDTKPWPETPDQGPKFWVDISVLGAPKEYALKNGNVVYKGKGKGGWVACNVKLNGPSEAVTLFWEKADTRGNDLNAGCESIDLKVVYV